MDVFLGSAGGGRRVPAGVFPWSGHLAPAASPPALRGGRTEQRSVLHPGQVTARRDGRPGGGRQTVNPSGGAGARPALRLRLAVGAAACRERGGQWGGNSQRSGWGRLGRAEVSSHPKMLPRVFNSRVGVDGAARTAVCVGRAAQGTPGACVEMGTSGFSGGFVA